MTCAEVDQDTYNRVQNDDELIFVCESCNQEELSSTASQVLPYYYLEQFLPSFQNNVSSIWSLGKSRFHLGVFVVNEKFKFFPRQTMTRTNQNKTQTRM